MAPPRDHNPGEDAAEGASANGDASERDKPLTDSLKKLLITGMSAVFMTEEGIRSALGDMRLPKEVIGSLMAQTDRSRRELFRTVADELKRYLRALDVPGEVRKALTGLKVEVKAEIRFVDDEEHTVEVETRPVRRRRPRDE